ncbi:MAG: FliM/FliN family flagellar motor C-terminal domain-containing protein [Rhodoblastus sp.]
MKETGAAGFRLDRQINLKPWTPGRLAAKGAGRRDGGLLERQAARLLREFAEEHLEEGVACPGGVEDDETIVVEAAIEKLEWPVTCRVRQCEAVWFAAALFGAGAEAAKDPNEAAFGRITDHIARRIVDVFLDKFCEAASLVCGAELVRRPEISTPKPAISGEEPAVITRKIEVTIEPCAVRAEFEMSAADFGFIVAEPGNVEPDAGPQASDGYRAYEDEIGRAVVLLTSTILDRDATFAEIKTWQVGTVVQLESTPNSMARLDIGGHMLFWCEIARNDDFFALRLLEELKPSVESHL